VKYRFVSGIFLVTFILILAACGSSTTTSSSQQGQTTPSGSQTVQVTLSDTKVDSSMTTFTAGMPYGA
jgi:ABC-type oligopeptide transport system substrate-binding subunit